MSAAPLPLWVGEGHTQRHGQGSAQPPLQRSLWSSASRSAAHAGAATAAASEAAAGHRFAIVSIGDGCSPTNKLWYLDLTKVPRHKQARRTPPRLRPLLVALELHHHRCYEAVTRAAQLLLYC